MISIFSKIKISAKQFWLAFVFIAIASIGQMVAPAMVSIMLSDSVENGGKYAELYNSQFA